MADVGIGLDVSYVAEEDMSAGQYKIVKQGAAGTGVLFSSSTVSVHMGVLQNAPVTDVGATVRISGRSKVLAGNGGLAIGSVVQGDASATGVSTTADNTQIIGITETAAASGYYATIRIQPGRY